MGVGSGPPLGGGGGGQPWLRRLLGISVAPQVGSIFNQAVRDNTAKRKNDVAARKTTELDATNHRRYRVSGKSLDAAGCTGEPLLVIARNRVFLCILHYCMAFGRLFMAFVEAHVGNDPPEVAGEVHKILYRNRWGMRLGAHIGTCGEEARIVRVLGLGTYCAPARIRRGGPHVASGYEAANIATHFVLANSRSATPLVPTCCCCVSETLLRGVGVAVFVVPLRGL